MKTNQNKVRKNQKGFTLIEMIVVIAIIGVLAAIITPSIMGQVNRSKINKNANNAKTIAMAGQAINSDSDNPYISGKYTIDGGAWVAGDGAGGDTGTGTGETPEYTDMSVGLTAMVGTEGQAQITFDANGAVEEVLYAPDNGTLPASGGTTTASVSGAKWHK